MTALAATLIAVPLIAVLAALFHIALTGRAPEQVENDFNGPEW